MGARAYHQPHFTDPTFEKQCPSTKENAPTQRCRNKPFCDRVGQRSLCTRRDDLVEFLREHEESMSQKERDEHAAQIALLSCCLGCRVAGRDEMVKRRIVLGMGSGKGVEQMEPQRGFVFGGMQDGLFGGLGQRPTENTGQPQQSPAGHFRAGKSPCSEKLCEGTPGAPVKLPAGREEFGQDEEESPFSNENPFQASARMKNTKTLKSSSDVKVENEDSPFSNENSFQSSRRGMKTGHSGFDEERSQRREVHDASSRRIEAAPLSRPLNRSADPSRLDDIDAKEEGSHDQDYPRGPDRLLSPSSIKTFQTARSRPEEHFLGGNHKKTFLPKQSSPLDQPNLPNSRLQLTEQERLRLRCEVLEGSAKKYKQKYEELVGCVQVLRRIAGDVNEKGGLGNASLEGDVKYEMKYEGLLRLMRVFGREVDGLTREKEAAVDRVKGTPGRKEWRSIE